jgi:RNA binding exosome subunit
MIKKGYVKIFLGSIIIIMISSTAHPTQIDDIVKGAKLPVKQDASDNNTIASGLKEALTLGTGNAVTSVSKVDGYFGNKMIKIPLPEKIQFVASALRKLGYQKQVDDFVLTMNRAAEKAAPQAKEIFIDAIKQMSFEDAQKILNGGNTAATGYFKTKTSKKIFEAFKPIVTSSMNEVGVTKSYNEMMGRYTSSVPFASKESLDLGTYVTNKASDGLFYMVGQEEKKIRTDPSARATDLLKKVFSK